MKPGFCEYYSGHIKDKCDAGVKYEDVSPRFRVNGYRDRLPCRTGNITGLCDNYEGTEAPKNPLTAETGKEK